MKKNICMATALCAAIFGGGAALGEDLDVATNAPAPATIEATQAQHSYAPYSTAYAEAAAEPDSAAPAVNVAPVASAEDVKWFSGSMVGSWYDGFLRKGNGHATNLNQIWLTGEKKVDTKYKGVDFGGRVDALFGTTNAQCVDGGFDGRWGVSGDGYAASIYQAYAEVGVGKLSAKIGKFGTIIGYEPFDNVPCALNTHTYMFNHEPTAHSGVLFNYAPGDVLSFDFGMVSGFDNSLGNRNGDTGFLFGATLNPAENLTLSYASGLMQTHNAEFNEFHYGLAGKYAGMALPNMNQYLQTVTLSSQLCEQLGIAVTTNYGSWTDRATKEELYRQVGVAGYVFNKLTDKLDANIRYEYYTQTYVPGSDKGRYHDLGFAFYYRPTENVFVRPDARYDWAVEDGSDSGFTGAVSVGVTF